MINYDYISSTPLYRLLEEHPLAGSYLENLRLADLPEELLARRSKIVLISTHDPLLALEADRRLVIQNGGIAAVLERTPEEENCLRTLSRMDELLQTVRSRLRAGKRIETPEGQEP